MICVACRRRHHEDCPGGTWCDCQHLPAPGTQASAEAGSQASAGADASPGDHPAKAAEPAMNWIHQG
jgi:hypothetical protein